MTTTPRGAGRLGSSDPSTWEADVVLRDGTVAHVRPIEPSDKQALQEFHSKQSAESIYLRFFAPIRRLSEADLVRYTEVDQHDRVALVATSRAAIIGVGRYDTVRPGVAEVAFNVSDAHQGKGIGSVLLEHLAAIGSELGVQTFVADVLPQNKAMINVFRDAGYEVTHHFEDGVVALAFDIAPTERSEKVRRSREHRAEALSVARVLRPRSVAVVGASPREDNAGHVVLRRLIDGGYQGEVHVVHPTAAEVCGLPAVSSVRDLADHDIDLVVVVVPAEHVGDVVDDCAAAGVGALLVMSGGLQERDVQLDLRARAHAAGMRVVGPHSYGVANTDPAVRLAALAGRAPDPGELALFVQSGAVGIACLGSLARRGIGVSVFLSAGNRLDVSGNDLMQFALDDARSRVLGLHLESVGNPRKFSRIAREVARVKPVVVVRSGQSGTAVPPGQTVRTAPVPAGAFDAMLAQAGVIPAASVHRMVDVVQLLLSQPLPAGDRVAVIGNTGALEAMTATVAVGEGLQVLGTPRLLSLHTTADEMREAVREALASEADAVVVCYEAPPVGAGDEVREAIGEAARGADKPVLATLLGLRGLRPELGRVPVYSMPEDAVLALAAVRRYAAWRARDVGERLSVPGARTDEVRALVAAALAEGDRQGHELDQDEVTSIAAAYGIALAGESGSTGGVVAGEPAAQVVVSTQENPLFGPLVSFSLAGPLPELLGDVAHRIAPLTRTDVDDLVRAVRAYPLLEQADPDGVGLAALADVVGRLSVLADDVPEIAALEAQVAVLPGAALVTGVRVRVARPGLRADADRRAMTA